MNSTHGVIAIFSKAPQAGKVKTRLEPELGAANCAKLQRQLLRHALTISLASRVGKVQIWCSPNSSHPEFTALKNQYKIELLEQAAGDLGARMAAAFAYNRKHKFVIIIGSDCPLLTAQDIKCAHSALDKSDVVFIAAQDGGYVLIGSSQSPQAFAGISWSTPLVLAQSIAKLQNAGQSHLVINTIADLDTAADWHALPVDLRRQLLPELD